METTTLEAIHADFAEQIRGITPDYPLHQGDRWAGPVDNLERLATATRRTFHMQWELDGEDFVEDGLYGDAIEHGSILRVYTSYVGLPDDGLTSTAMIHADRRQLWLALENRLDPHIPGLVKVASPTWEYGSTEPGLIWGAHVFGIRHLADAYTP